MYEIYFRVFLLQDSLGLDIWLTNLHRVVILEKRVNGGYYMPARGYELYLRVFNSISHEWAQRTREILSWTREDKIRIHARAYNILFII